MSGLDNYIQSRQAVAETNTATIETEPEMSSVELYIERNKVKPPPPMIDIGPVPFPDLAGYEKVIDPNVPREEMEAQLPLTTSAPKLADLPRFSAEQLTKQQLKVLNEYVQSDKPMQRLADVDMQAAFRAYYKEMSPIERTAAMAKDTQFNVWGLRDWMSRKGWHSGELFDSLMTGKDMRGTQAAQLAAIRDILREDATFGQQLVHDVAQLPQTAAEFLLAGIPLRGVQALSTGGKLLKTGSWFGLHELLTAPTAEQSEMPLGEYVKEKGLAAGAAGGTGVLVGGIGGKLTKAATRIPAVTGTLAAKSYGETYYATGGDTDAAKRAAIQTAVQVLGFEAIGLAEGAADYMYRKATLPKTLTNTKAGRKWAKSMESELASDIAKAKRGVREKGEVPEAIRKKYGRVGPQKQKATRTPETAPPAADVNAAIVPAPTAQVAASIPGAAQIPTPAPTPVAQPKPAPQTPTPITTANELVVRAKAALAVRTGSDPRKTDIELAKVPGITEVVTTGKDFAPELPKGRKGNEIETAEELALQHMQDTPDTLWNTWWGQKAEMEYEADLMSKQFLERTKAIVGETKRGPNTKAAELAGLLNVDLRNSPEDIMKFLPEMSPDIQAAIDYSQNISPEFRAILDEVIAANAEFGAIALDVGVIKNTVDNYLARLYEQEKSSLVGGAKRGAQYLVGKFGTTAGGRAKPRKYSSILEGLANGKRLAVPSFIGAFNVARKQTARAIADKRFLDEAMKMGIISSVQHPGWRKLNHPNFKKYEFAGTVKGATEVDVRGQHKFLLIPQEGREAHTLLEAKELYAPKPLAIKLNNALGISALDDVPFFNGLTLYNDILKHNVLTANLYHPQAFLRSFMLGGNVGFTDVVNPYGAYKKGMAFADEFSPDLREMVRQGLTLQLGQDWEVLANRQRTIFGKLLEKNGATAEVRDKILDIRDTVTDWTFNKLGLSYKTYAAILEYRHQLSKHNAKLEAGTMTRQSIAGDVARLINNDFGGLDVRREGRNPTVEHLKRLLLLARDWTGSNFRSMVDSMRKGNAGAVHRMFWTRILLKAASSTILANLLISSIDDEMGFWERYKHAWDEGRLRWMDIDITPLVPKILNKSGRRKYFSLIGHLRDPIKWISDPSRSVKHKGSILARIVGDVATGTDWAQRVFTDWKELLGIDEKGVYQTSRSGEYYAGDPKGGKHKGKLVRPETWKDEGSLQYGQIPSWLLYELRSVQPIAVQNAMAFLAGEMDAFDAMFKSAGFMVSSGKPAGAFQEGLEGEGEPEVRGGGRGRRTRRKATRIGN